MKRYQYPHDAFNAPDDERSVLLDDGDSPSRAERYHEPKPDERRVPVERRRLR